jgi:hypothetical protein
VEGGKGEYPVSESTVPAKKTDDVDVFLASLDHPLKPEIRRWIEYV